MSFLGPTVTLRLDRDSNRYSWGDCLRGQVIVKTDKSCSIKSLDILLRCTETASNYVNDWSGSPFNHHQITNHCRAYSYRQTLFPAHIVKSGEEKPIEWSNLTSKPVNTWADEFNMSYTLQKGTHTFDFQFMIPSDFPPTLYVDSVNYVQWNVTAKLFKGRLFKSSSDVSKPIFVYRNSTIMPDPSMDPIYHKKASVNIASETGDNSPKSGLLAVLSKKCTAPRKESPVDLYLKVPGAGILQDPHTMSLKLLIKTNDSDHIFLKSCRMKLLRIVHISLRSCNEDNLWATETRTLTSLLFKKVFDTPLDRSLAILNRNLRNLKVTGHYSESFRSRLFHVEYTLEVDLTFASKDGHHDMQTVQMKVPMEMQSCLAHVIDNNDKSYSSNSDDCSPCEFLPAYNSAAC